MNSFGLAQIKREGWLFNDDGDTCPALSKELREALSDLHIVWYLKPFKKTIHKIATNFWNSALITR